MAELLVAVTILGLVFGVVLDLVTTSQVRTAAAQDRLAAMNILHSEMNEIRVQARLVTLTQGSTNYVIATDTLPSSLSISRSISTSGTGNLFAISYTATWTHPTIPSRSGSVSLHSYVTKKNL